MMGSANPFIININFIIQKITKVTCT